MFCRVKPHPKPALACLPDGLSVKAEVDGKEQVFAFDKVFAAGVAQKAVFDEVSELVQCALDGYQVSCGDSSQPAEMFVGGWILV